MRQGTGAYITEYREVELSRWSWWQWRPQECFTKSQKAKGEGSSSRIAATPAEQSTEVGSWRVVGGEVGAGRCTGRQQNQVGREWERRAIGKRMRGEGLRRAGSLGL